LAPNYAVILQSNRSQAYEVQHVAEGERAHDIHEKPGMPNVRSETKKTSGIRV
jgi:hypothetical protein